MQHRWIAPSQHCFYFKGILQHHWETMNIIHGQWGDGRMKTYVLSHFSALHWLLSHRDPRVGNNAPHLDVPASSDAPDSQVVEELRWTIGLEGPLDFLVIGDGALRRSSAVCPHRCSQDIPPGSLIPIACRAHDAEMLVCCPELAFLQICQAVDTLAAIYFGMCVCSDFRFDSFALGGVVFRSEGGHAIASQNSIARYLDRSDGLKGAKRARLALRHVRDHARSPKECALGMMFCLPARLGGFDLGDPSFNEMVRVFDGSDRRGKPRYSIRYPDIAIRSTSRKGERCMVFVDYDPASTHSGMEKMMLDSRRRNDMATIRDVPHFTITSDDAMSFEYLEKLADRMRRLLGRRSRPLLRGAKDSAESREVLLRTQERRRLLWLQFVVRSFDSVLADYACANLASARM